MGEGCIHLEFDAFCEVHRLFSTDEQAAKPESNAPESLAIDLTISCRQCGKRVRFEGPIGINVGPAAPPTVSIDGCELRASGHLGENRTPPVRIRFTPPEAST